MAWHLQLKRDRLNRPSLRGRWISVPPDRFWQEPPMRFWSEDQILEMLERDHPGDVGRGLARAVKADNGAGDEWLREVSFGVHSG